jgi:hypothetical protein
MEQISLTIGLYYLYRQCQSLETSLWLPCSMRAQIAILISVTDISNALEANFVQLRFG